MQQLLEGVAVPSRYPRPDLSSARLLGPGAQRHEVLFLGVPADYEGPSEARSGEPPADVCDQRTYDLRADRDRARERCGDLSQAVREQGRYDAFDASGSQLAGCPAA